MKYYECVFYSHVNTQNFITKLSQQLDCTVITPKLECIINVKCDFIPRTIICEGLILRRVDYLTGDIHCTFGNISYITTKI